MDKERMLEIAASLYDAACLDKELAKLLIPETIAAVYNPMKKEFDAVIIKGAKSDQQYPNRRTTFTLRFISGDPVGRESVRHRVKQKLCAMRMSIPAALQNA